MKKLLCIFILAITLILSVSCKGSIAPEKKEELCSWYWESYVDVMRFTEDGMILRNFQFLHESDSRYTITDKEITMYLTDFPEDAMTFSYRFEDDKLYIGDVEYRRYKQVTEAEKQEARDYVKVDAASFEEAGHSLQ